MIKISDRDRELLKKLDCDEDIWIFLENQFLATVDTNRDIDPLYWSKKAGYISGRLRGLLAAIRAHEETQCHE